MKAFITSITNKLKLVDKTFVLYTCGFLACMLIIYFYMIFANMSTAPKFTYAQF